MQILNLLTGPTEIDAVPSVLKSEVALMCSELGNKSLGQTAPWEKSEGVVGGLKWWTGCHVSTSGGIERAVINAAAIGTGLCLSRFLLCFGRTCHSLLNTIDEGETQMQQNLMQASQS